VKAIITIFFMSIIISSSNAEELFSNTTKITQAMHTDDLQVINENNQEVSIKTEKDRSLIANIKVSTDDGALVVDTTEAFAKGAKNVPCYFKTKISNGNISTGDKELSLTVIGSKNQKIQLLISGMTADKKHYWKRTNRILNGEKQVLTFSVTIDQELISLQGRVDLASSGIFKIYDVSFSSKKK